VRREEIIRSDFPAARRGYNRGAVEEHLRGLADEIERLQSPAGAGGASLAETAGEKVAGILEAAEAKAAELEQEARRRAEQIVEQGREEAASQVARAQEAVTGLVSQAAELRERVGALGRNLGAAEQVPEPTIPTPEVVPEPVVVPEPEPPEETPIEPEPMPAPVPLPERPDEPPPAAANGDEAGARLVALKMALDGASRTEIAERLAQSYDLANADALLDDVLARAAK
jgi:hypothetical protein